MRSMTVVAAMTAVALGLSACGETTGERAVTGGGLGAGLGAATAAAASGNIGIGALMGGGLGIALGALMTSQQVDLGKPAWDYWQ